MELRFYVLTSKYWMNTMEALLRNLELGDVIACHCYRTRYGGGVSLSLNGLMTTAITTEYCTMYDS